MANATPAIDARASRTRTRLHHALKGLIHQKAYEAISITEICTAAKVSRSTFYAHYASKDDLRRGSLECMRRELAQHSGTRAGGHSQEAGLGFSRALFEHAREHLRSYKALAGGRGGEVTLARIREIVAGLVREELAAPAGKAALGAMPREFAVRFIVGAYMSVLTWWLDNGAKLPPDRMDALFRSLALEGLAKQRAAHTGRPPKN